MCPTFGADLHTDNILVMGFQMVHTEQNVETTFKECDVSRNWYGSS